MTKTIIIGAGFGGLQAAKDLKSTDVLVIDKLNHHLFQPLLYQVATCALESSDIATPVREVLYGSKNTSFIMGCVDRIDKDAKKVHLACSMSFDYDYLIVAPGASHSYFGHDEWESYAPGLKTLEDAARIREKILMAFEEAERAPTHDEALKYLRFAIVGAGPTGVELAGSIAEIAFKGLKKKYKIRPEDAKIYLIEGAPSILPGFDPELATKAKKMLEKLGVEVITDQKVTDVTPDGVMINKELLEAKNVLWAAGNQASPLLKTLDTPLDHQGRVIVEQDLSIPDHPNIFVVGDAAHFKTPQGTVLPGLAPVAKQGASYVAKIINKEIPKEKRKPFHYHDKGSLATIGKGKAIGSMGKIKISGFFAWLIWSVIHIFYLINFRSRLKVFFHWSYLYITGKRAMMLIMRPIESTPEDKE